MLKICKIGISTEVQRYRGTEEWRDTKVLLYHIAQNLSTTIRPIKPEQE